VILVHIDRLRVQKEKDEVFESFCITSNGRVCSGLRGTLPYEDLDRQHWLKGELKDSGEGAITSQVSKRI
jgi:hypothetical protein